MRLKAGAPEQLAIHEIRARVLLDGRPLAHCMEADDGAGWAIVADTDELGRIKINRQRDEVIERKVYGSIRFELISDHARHSAQGRRWLSGRRPQ